MTQSADAPPRPPSALRRTQARVGAIREWVRSKPGGHMVWRVGVTVVGIVVVAIGIVLLPLPGPGWLIIFAGLGMLASEYPWAARLLVRVKHFVLRWTQWATQQSMLVRVLVGIAGLLVAIAAIALTWWIYRVV